MKRLGKYVLTAIGALLLFWFLTAADMSESSKLGWLLICFVLWINYETNTAKDRMAELEWRIEDLERKKHR